MDPKERFRQAFAEEQEILSRQPIAAEAASAEKRERWAQTVTPVIEFMDWLRAQSEQDFGFHDGRVEKTDRWTTELAVYHAPHVENGIPNVQYVQRVLNIEVTPANQSPFCWSAVDQKGRNQAAHCHDNLNAFLGEIAEHAAKAFAGVIQERAGRTRKT